jgi:hypothetical protein
MPATNRQPRTVETSQLQWWGEGAEQLQAFSSYLLCEVHVTQ